ncbi:MAG: AI-2E family transporter [Vampirovibrionales bacterium]|nr:AI-2E family transporter [Vampirovibrionales bacterium]
MPFSSNEPAADGSRASQDALIRLLTIVSTVLVLAAGLAILNVFWSLAIMLGFCTFLTSLLLGPVSFLEKAVNRLGIRRLWGRALAVGLTYAAFFTLVALAAVRLTPVLGQQIGDFAHALPKYVLQAETLLIDWSDRTFGSSAVKSLFRGDIEDARQAGVVSHTTRAPEARISSEEKKVIQASVIRATLTQTSNLAEKTLSESLGGLSNVLTGTLNGLMYTIAGLLLVFYLLMDAPRLRPWLESHASGERLTALRFWLESLPAVIQGFIKGQVLLGMATGAYMFIIYSLFGVKYAFFLAVFLAVCEILPVVGTWIGLLPAFIVMLFGENPMVTPWVWLCSYGWQTIKDNILAPRVVGQVMGLHPVAVILSLVICAKLAGLFGVLAAIPLAGILNVALQGRPLADKLVEESESAPAS